MSRSDRFDFTLDEETEKRLYDLLTDMDTRKTDRFWIQDKRGYHAEYVKVIRCKDCKHWYCYGDESFCSELGIADTNKDSYCSYAKREEK